MAHDSRHMHACMLTPTWFVVIITLDFLPCSPTVVAMLSYGTPDNTNPTLPFQRLRLAWICGEAQYAWNSRKIVSRETTPSKFWKPWRAWRRATAGSRQMRTAMMTMTVLVCDNGVIISLHLMTANWSVRIAVLVQPSGGLGALCTMKQSQCQADSHFVDFFFYSLRICYVVYIDQFFWLRAPMLYYAQWREPVGEACIACHRVVRRGLNELSLRSRSVPSCVWSWYEFVRHLEHLLFDISGRSFCWVSDIMTYFTCDS